MKPKYKINPETLSFVKNTPDKYLLLKNILLILLSGVFFGFLFIIIAAYLYPTHYERQLKQDLIILEKNYNELLKKIEESAYMYEQLLEEEKQIQKLTFDTELEQLQLYLSEITLHSTDFDFQKQLNITSDKLYTISDIVNKNLLKMKLLLDISYARKHFIESIPAILPLEKGSFVLASGYGMRIHPIFKTMRQHNGIDFAAQQGTPVVATGSGVVIRPPGDLDLLGNTVVIDHGFDYISIYACLLRPQVRPGNKVERGQIIGYVGRSGVTFGPHLHYEIRKNQIPVNPINYFFLSITPKEFQDFLEKSSEQNQCMS